VVSETNVRVYHTDMSSRTMTKYAINAYTTVGFKKLGTMMTLGITATETIYKFFTSTTLSPLLFSFKVSQNTHAGSGQSKIAVRGDLNS